CYLLCFFFQAEDGIRDDLVTGVQTCALPICVANPIASIWSGQLLLDHLGEQEAAATLMRAIGEVLAAGHVRTPDLGGTSTTRQQIGRASCREREERSVVRSALIGKNGRGAVE